MTLATRGRSSDAASNRLSAVDLCFQVGPIKLIAQDLQRRLGRHAAASAAQYFAAVSTFVLPVAASRRRPLGADLQTRPIHRSAAAGPGRLYRRRAPVLLPDGQIALNQTLRRRWRRRRSAVTGVSVQRRLVARTRSSGPSWPAAARSSAVEAAARVVLHCGRREEPPAPLAFAVHIRAGCTGAACNLQRPN